MVINKLLTLFRGNGNKYLVMLIEWNFSIDLRKHSLTTLKHRQRTMQLHIHYKNTLSWLKK